MSKLIADANQVKQAMAKITGLQVPSPPALLLNISNELAKPDPNKKMIIDLINEDIALAGKVLQIVNSPAYGLRNKVKSVDHAVNLLGLPRLKSHVIAGALRYALEKSLPGFEAISEYSHCVGVGAQLIAKQLEDISSEDAYIAGLFHEAGTMMMLQLFPDYKAFYQEQRINIYAFVEQEQQKYDVMHTVIGFMLAFRWKLPEDICNIIYVSHSHITKVDESMQRLLAALHIGISLANDNVLGLVCEQGMECRQMLTDALDMLGINESQYASVTDAFNEQI